METIEILKRLKSMHDDDINGIKGDGVISLGLIPFNGLIKVLEAQQNSWKTLELP